MGDTEAAKQVMVLKRIHDQRLRAIYRSAGWPCLDPIEIELLAAGLVERVQPARGPEYLRVTDAGVQRLAVALGSNRSARDRHELLMQRVAEEQVRQGRIAFQGLTLLGKPGESWLHLRPDVFSIRNTTREDRVEPVVHEIKVSRADLLGDLKKPDKRAGYRAVSTECYYVLAEGIGTADDVPPECGVMMATATTIERVRASPTRPMTLGFSTWMALAKARRVDSLDDPAAQL